MKIEEEIKQMVLGLSNSSRNDLEDNLILDYSMDSVEIIQLIVKLEEKYDIEFDDEDLDFEKICNINSLISIVEDKRKVV